MHADFSYLTGSIKKIIRWLGASPAQGGLHFVAARSFTPSNIVPWLD